MKRRIIILLAYLVSLFCYAYPTDTKPFFFIQLSDPQFGFMDNNKSICAEEKAMSKAVQAINRVKPPFVVVTGDFVNNSCNQAQIDAYKSCISKIDPSVKVYMVPGNHDIGSISNKSIGDYKKNYGYTRFSFSYSNCTFIGIDTNIIKEEDEIRETEQFKWLENELSKAANSKFKFIFTHHPFFINNVEEAETYSNFPLTMRNKYIELLKKYSVNAVFSGHYHNNAYGKVDDMEFITIGPIGKALGIGYQGFNIVKVYTDRFLSEFISLNQLPQTIEMNDETFRTTKLMSNIRFKSLDNLVMTGYQGWFNTPNDGAGLGWKHFEKNKQFEPGKCTIDLWPDMSEYVHAYDTKFKFSDGSTAKVFSSSDSTTTDLHFKWMQEYGIDGAFMQRFIVSIKKTKDKDNYDKILKNAIISAERYDRAICLMYDLSGMKSGDEELLIKDWLEICSNYSLVNRRNNHYIYYNGKPLVAVWGAGFNDNREYGYEQIRRIISFFNNNNCSILLGVPTHWRTLKMDAVPDEKLLELIENVDIVQPWLVGRFNNETYAPFKKVIEEDINWCNNRSKGYLPVLFPGFSWHNMKPETKSNLIPRLGGEFFWNQVIGAIKAGAKCLYLAMFDEIDEGTAFFKCTNNPPCGKSTFITYEGKPADYYLFLAGEAGKCLRGEKKDDSMPIYH